MQYFERAVFEWHPEYAGTPYEVLLSQLGTFKFARAGSAPQPLPALTTENLSDVSMISEDDGWAVTYARGGT